MLTRRSKRVPDDEVRREHEIAYEDPLATSDGRIFCSCGWCSEIAPRVERLRLLARHVAHAVNAEEWCHGDLETARRRYYEIEAM